MSSPNSYPFDKEADAPREPEENLGETALHGEGTQINVSDESGDPYHVDVDVSASPFDQNDALSGLGYSQDDRAGELDPRDQT